MDDFFEYCESACLVAAGVILGTMLTTRDGKKTLAKATAAGLRAGKYLSEQMKVVERNAKVVFEQAKAINEEPDRD